MEVSEHQQGFRERQVSEVPLQEENNELSYTLELEMEDFSDVALLKGLAQELGVDGGFINFDPLRHDAGAGQECVHCKILGKISGLQGDITKMNQEIGATNEILRLKQEQNLDLKGMINRLEENLGCAKDDDVVEKSAVSCSCTKKCVVC